MSYRSDSEAQRARNAVLEDDLAIARAEVREARRERDAARRRGETGPPSYGPEPRRSRAPKPVATRHRPDPVKSGVRWMVLLLVPAFGLAWGVPVFLERLAHGAPLVEGSTSEGRLLHAWDCACTLADGTALGLDARVVSADFIGEGTGKLARWKLAWEASTPDRSMGLEDPMGGSNFAPNDTVQQQLDFGYVRDVGLGCASEGRFVTSNGGTVTGWQLGKSGPLWTKSVPSSSRPRLLSGRRVELACHALRVDGDIVRMRTPKGEARIRVSTGALE